MSQASYSFLDVAALDEVRERFAAGHALVILSRDLEDVIWANGPGAALFGHADVEAALGAQAPLGAAAKRQISAIRGFPAIGRDRMVAVRVTTGVSSRALQFLASALTLPDGEEAILLAQPAARDAAADETARRAIGGFTAAGHFLAFVDAQGAVEAASAGFERLGLTQDALADMAREAGDGQRIVKRMLTGRRGSLPAGLARLTEARHLLVAIDENFADEPEEEVAAPAAEIAGVADMEAAGEAAILAAQQAAEEAMPPPAPVREIWYLGSGDVAAEGEAPAAEPAWPQTADSEQAVAESETRVHAEPAAENAPEAVGEAPGGEAKEDEAKEPDAADAASSEPAIVEQAEAVAVDTAHETPEPGAAERAPLAQEPAATTVPASAAQESSPVQRATGLVRFVWRTDADGKFSQISPEFALAVGEVAADIVGRRFEHVANAFGLDPTGEIAGLLARRDTWSGRSVAWPVAGTDLKIPVDLAALPVYDRARNFQGFRGFGVARTADAAPDPERMGLTLTRLPLAAETTEPEAPAAEEGPAAREPNTQAAEGAPAAETPEDPFRGEKPALTVAPAPDRRYSDKIIRLAEHRPPPANDRAANGGGGAPERSLSTGERIAFQQIGERLKKESGAAEPEAQQGAPAREAEPAGPQAAVGEPDETIPAAEVAELEALDGVTEEPAEAREAEAAKSTEAEALDTSKAAEAPAEPAQEPVAVEAPQEPATRTRKPGRPGMSLLDFAQWGKEEAADEPSAAAEGASEAAATVEMEEASALEGRAPPAAAGDEIAAAEAVTAEPEPSADEPGGKVEAPAAGQGEDESGEPGSQPDAQADAGTSRETEGPQMGTPGAEIAAPASAETGTAGTTGTEAAAAGEAATAATPVVPLEKPSGKSGLSILEKLPVPVLVHSGDTLHYANDEFFAMTGYRSVEELAAAGGIGALFVDPYDDTDEEPGRKADRHMRLKTRDGKEFPVEAFLQSVPWEGGKALLLVLSRPRDGASSGQSPLIAELEARVAELRTIIDTATDGVVLIARDGTIRSISRPAEALFGMDSDEVAGKPFFSLFAIESQKAARDYLNGLSDHGVASVLNDGREVIGREAQGRFIPLFMTIGKLPGDSGYCAVVRDITQWKRAEEELTQARATAERASTYKTEFLARVSHEIRTPLNAIIGFSELMLDEKFGPVANDRYRDYLRDINRSGNHVLDLVNDLLDISKIEAGQQEMAYEAVSLNETLAETVALMQPQANRERVIIRSSFASKLPDVVADLRSVRQIALNILSNAVRYTQAGGQVIVSTAYENNGEVVVRVRDTGIGMTPAEIEQALKPFKQINSLKRTRGDGTGLGLPLTKAMVEANRAKFTIHSTPGEGTLVEVAFPSTRVLAD